MCGSERFGESPTGQHGGTRYSLSQTNRRRDRDRTLNAYSSSNSLILLALPRGLVKVLYFNILSYSGTRNYPTEFQSIFGLVSHLENPIFSTWSPSLCWGEQSWPSRNQGYIGGRCASRGAK